MDCYTSKEQFQRLKVCIKHYKNDFPKALAMYKKVFVFEYYEGCEKDLYINFEGKNPPKKIDYKKYIDKTFKKVEFINNTYLLTEY